VASYSHSDVSTIQCGKVLGGEVADAAEEIIRETCKELDIEIIDLAESVDHVDLFIKYPPKYSVSWIAKRIKGRSSKLLRDQFPRLKVWCRSGYSRRKGKNTQNMVHIAL
jgi:putative transposase